MEWGNQVMQQGNWPWNGGTGHGIGEPVMEWGNQPWKGETGHRMGEQAMERGNRPWNGGAGHRMNGGTGHGTGHGMGELATECRGGVGDRHGTWNRPRKAGGNQPWKGEELATERGDWPRNGGTGHGTEELAMERGNWTWNRGTGPGRVCPSPEPCLLGSCFHFALRPLPHSL